MARREDGRPHDRRVIDYTRDLWVSTHSEGAYWRYNSPLCRSANFNTALWPFSPSFCAMCSR